MSVLFWLSVKITGFIVWILTDQQGLEFATFCILLCLLVIFITLSRIYEEESNEGS